MPLYEIHSKSKIYNKSITSVPPCAESSQEHG